MKIPLAIASLLLATVLTACGGSGHSDSHNTGNQNSQNTGVQISPNTGKSQDSYSMGYEFGYQVAEANPLQLAMLSGLSGLREVCQTDMEVYVSQRGDQGINRERWMQGCVDALTKQLQNIGNPFQQ
jgi:hypothetical protein